MITVKINLENHIIVMAPREMSKTPFSRFLSAKTTVYQMPLRNIALSLLTWDILPQTP